MCMEATTLSRGTQTCGVALYCGSSSGTMPYTIGADDTRFRWGTACLRVDDKNDIFVTCDDARLELGHLPVRHDMTSHVPLPVIHDRDEDAPRTDCSTNSVRTFSSLLVSPSVFYSFFAHTLIIP